MMLWKRRGKGVESYCADLGGDRGVRGRDAGVGRGAGGGYICGKVLVVARGGIWKLMGQQGVLVEICALIFSPVVVACAVGWFQGYWEWTLLL